MQCNAGLSKFVVDSTNLLIEPFETDNIETFKLLGLQQMDKKTRALNSLVHILLEQRSRGSKSSKKDSRGEKRERKKRKGVGESERTHALTRTFLSGVPHPLHALAHQSNALLRGCVESSSRNTAHIFQVSCVW